MSFNTHQIDPLLGKYIESIFHFKDFMPDHSIERVVPTGHIFVLFELDNIPRNTFDNETLEPIQTFTKVWISGMHQNYISISAHQHSEMLVIQFKPFGAYPFLHIPLRQLTERVWPAEQIVTELLTLRDEIVLLSDASEKFRKVESWLHQQFDQGNLPPAELLTVVERLQQEPCAKYLQIVEAYPRTQKHLIDQFKKYVGLTPKRFQRILRFNEILQQINRQEELGWSQVAYQCGYADQSHFIKEFRHFSGFNPKEFIQQEFNSDELNFFPLDRKG